MGFMDELKRLAHPYEDEGEDDFEDFEVLLSREVLNEEIT